MKMVFVSILMLIAAAALSVEAQVGGQSVFNQPVGQDVQKVVVSASASAARVSPGGQIVIAAVMRFADGWHAWPSAQQDVLPDGFDFAIRTEVGLSEQPEWLIAGPVQWPELHDARVPNLSTSGPPTVEVPTYSGNAVVYIPLLIAQEAPLGVQTISIRLMYQACDETSCLAPKSETLTIPIELVALAQSGSDDTFDAELFASFDASVFQDMLAGNVAASSPSESLNFDLFGIVTFDLHPDSVPGLLLLVIVAALGGFLLNLTPCVLPVIPLKIMGLSHSAGNPRRALYLGTIMSVGVVGFWMVIGAAIAFVAGFDSISTLFQTSFFSTGVGLFIGIMGIGMLGVFTVQLPKAVYMINPSHETAHGSLLFGVMTAILSTPCTAPFMGTAAAWATQQASGVVLLVFAAIGTGMALPYFVLSANPKWVDKVPRTGPSSELIKQVMGLFMLAVAAFFIGTGVMPLFTQAGHSPSQMYWWVVALFVIGAMVWLVWKTFRISKRFVPRAVFTVLGVAMAGSGVLLAMNLTAKPPLPAIAFVAGFDSISTLFQTSFFSTGVGLFIGIMGIGMLGVFTVQLPKAVYMINPSHETAHGSLLFGVMTAILSTPCTAPFMGTAAAWATQQASGVVLLVFAAIGTGMALPYFVLSANPKWVDKVPRTGPSSELIKQVMGLFMLAVAAFFIGTGVMPLFTQAGHSPSQMYWWVVALFVIGAMVWLVWKTFRISKRFVPRAVFTVLGVAMAGSGVLLAMNLTAKPPIDWSYYSPELFEEVRARGDVVVLDFTADWCLNCKVLERAVLYSDSVVAVLQQEGVVAMKIDLTRGTQEENAMLQSVGRITIPLLAVFGPGVDEPWLSDSYSKAQVIEAVEQARGSDVATTNR